MYFKINIRVPKLFLFYLDNINHSKCKVNGSINKMTQ